MMRRAGEAMRRFEAVSGRGRWRSPCRWAVDRTAVRSDGDYVGQLAFFRKVAGNVLVVSCSPFKMFGDSHMGIEHEHRFPKLMAKGVNGPRLIGISCYQNKAVDNWGETPKRVMISLVNRGFCEIVQF